MHYQHDIKSSESYALASFQEMKKHAVPYNPVNFSVWYNYHAKVNPELVNRMQELINAQQSISDDQASALFDEFVSGEILNKSRRISEQLSNIAREITTNLEQTGKTSGDYVGQIETLQKDLSTVGSIGAADDVINNILTASRNATNEIHDLREKSRLHQEQMDDLKQELESIRDESRTDQLTGIANRRQFDERLQQLCELSAKTNEPFSLVLADIDHFKNFNDRFGHQAGDQVLAIVGGKFRQNVKAKDLAARYGGEEFALLLPNTPLTAAIAFADTLRILIGEKKINLDGSEQTVTMSFGVAQFDGQESPKSLISRADKHLYQAKNAGRNAVYPLPTEADDFDFEVIEIAEQAKPQR